MAGSRSIYMEYLEKVCAQEGISLEDLNYEIMKSAEKSFSAGEREDLWLEYYDYKFDKVYPDMPKNLSQALAYYWLETGIPGRIYSDTRIEGLPLIYEWKQVIGGIGYYFTRVLYDAGSETIYLTDVTGKAQIHVSHEEMIENLESKNVQYFHNLILDHLNEGGNLRQ